jgi:hypothetical protein
MTQFFEKDGTSQAHRIDPALKPESIAVDERTLKDWLAFAHAFSGELKYFDLNNQASGDWSSFLNPEQLNSDYLSAQWEEIEKFLAAPEKFNSAEFNNFRRPHFVLFLAFLQLLKLTQGRLNTLTRRHLDFYFQEVLRLKKKSGIPDRVHIIVEASSYTEQVQLPVGTLLNAGKDKLGKELAYSTDNEIIVNHAQIERLSSVFVHKQMTGIREAREQNQDDHKGIINMLEIALGDPLPGDKLPLYANKDMNFDFLRQLQKLVGFASAKAGLFLDLWELRSLILVKNRQQEAKDAWTTINTILEQAGKSRTKNENFKLKLTNIRDFDANLTEAFGGKLEDDPGFKELLLVNNIYDLYRESSRDERDDVRTFIIKKLFMTLVDFVRMMELKTNIDNDWRYVNSLLEQAGRQRTPPVSFPDGFDYASPNFDANLKSALGTLVFPVVDGTQAKNLDEYDQSIKSLESYFFMKAEDFLFMMNMADTQTPDWETVYEKLAIAHQEKVYTARRAELKSLKTETTLTLEEQKKTVEDMIDLAFDDANVNVADPNVKERIISLLPKGLDLSVIDKITKADNKDLLKDEEWQTVYEQLELVWRNRLGKEPVAQKQNWLYLSANPDAKSVMANIDSSRWRTFGQTPNSVDQTHTPEARLGWIISSPLLALSQGFRTVTLTLTFQSFKISTKNIAILLANKMFKLQMSSAKDWIEAVKTTVSIEPGVEAGQDIQEKTSITWMLEFDQSIPPITPLLTENIFIDSQYPLLRLLLLPRWEITNGDGSKGRYITDYPLFQSFLLEHVLLNVDVKGMTDFHVQNDDTVLTSTKPFEPFGSYPTVGSRLYFGHSELVNKPLSRIDLNLQWMGVANDLKTHYAGYTNPPVTTTVGNVTTTPTAMISANTIFKATLNLSDQNQEVRLTADTGKELFKAFNAANKTDATTLNTISIAPVAAQKPDLTVSTDDELKSWQRYFYLELKTPDFQHSAYPTIAAAKSIGLAAAIANKEAINATNYQINPPYTPKLKSFSINYVAEQEIIIADYKTGGAERIYHQHPFGYAEIEATKSTDGTGYCNFLPCYDNEGELYIGLNHVKPPQQLSMLMQMAEGSANPNLDLATVEWSYLSGNRWINLHNSKPEQGHIMADATHGLIDSGIIKLQLVPVLPNTLLPPQLYWLRAAVIKNCDSVCDTVDSHTQAVVATFVNQDNSPDHLSQPLPVDTISKTLEPLSDITAIQQPYTSFGGKSLEQDAMFNVRVSERLRHKQRALTAWDYERLILENFPQIYKTKCLLPQTLPKHPSDLGKVDIIVIPDIRGRIPFNPFEPKAPAGLLAEIRDFLSNHIPPSANISVKNAHYVPVRVRVAVRFMPDRDPEFYKRQLNEDLNRFLAPWAYDANADIVIGGSIYANAIINFLDRLDYVDYLAQFKLFSSEDGSIFKPVPEPSDADGYRVQAGRPDNVLVAAREHQIDLITEARFVNQNFTGINYMRIELDFIVG